MTLVKSLTLVSAFLLGWMGFTPTAQAQQGETTAAPAPLEKSLLWKVTGKGIKPSYLFYNIAFFVILPASSSLFSSSLSFLCFVV